MIAEIRDGLAAALPAGLNVHKHPVESVSPPAAVILRGALDPVIDHQAGATISFSVLLLLQASMFTESSRQLDHWIDPDSPGYIVSFIEADQSLGGLVGGVQVTNIGAEQLTEIGGTNFTSCAIDVDVIR